MFSHFKITQIYLVITPYNEKLQNYAMFVRLCENPKIMRNVQITRKIALSHNFAGLILASVTVGTIDIADHENIGVAFGTAFRISHFRLGVRHLPFEASVDVDV
jgi:hypothetical protein